MKRVIFFVVAMWVGFSAVAAEKGMLPTDESVLGKVGDTPITLGEVQTKEIHELREKLYEAMQNVFVSTALEHLKKSDKGISGIQLPELREDEVRRFYDENGLSRRGSYEELAPQIRQYLKRSFQAEVDYAIFMDARKKGKVTSNLRAPSAFMVKVPVETAFIRGKEDAGVMLLEFSDFQCPFCKKVQPTLQALVKEYGDRVAFGYRHFPLSFHQQADESAVASECAREQGKFLQMHERLYGQQTKQPVEELKRFAQEIGVADMDKFNSCLSSDKYRSLLDRDMEVAQAVGISGTPAFIIGTFDKKSGILEGELLSGAQPAKVFTQMLDKYLAGASKTN